MLRQRELRRPGRFQGSGTGVPPVRIVQPTHGRDARATTGLSALQSSGPNSRLTLCPACTQYPSPAFCTEDDSRADKGTESAIGTMNLDSLYSELTLKTNAKLALVVLDGLGDIATKAQGEVTPLEAAKTPNLDALVGDGCAQGRMIPV